jgi:hypothetical protein
MMYVCGALLLSSAVGSVVLPRFGAVTTNRDLLLGIEPPHSESCAWGWYNDSIDNTGWSTLEIHTNESCNNVDQMFAAGKLEGALTQHRSKLFLDNNFGTQRFAHNLRTFLADNDSWMRSQIAANPGDVYWEHVNLSLIHWEGLYAGYNATAPPSEALDAGSYFLGTLQGPHMLHPPPPPPRLPSLALLCLHAGRP